MDAGKSRGIKRVVARNTAVLLVGRVVTGVLGVISIGITTRYLDISGYGTLVTATLIVSVLGSFADGGLANLGVREMSLLAPRRSGLLLTSLLWLRGLTGVGATLVLLNVALLTQGRLRDALLILSPVLLVEGAQTVLSVPLEVRLRSYQVVAGDILGKATALIGLLAVVAVDGGFGLLVASQLLGICVNAGYDALLGLRVQRPARVVPLDDVRRLASQAVAVGVVVIVSTVYLRVDGLLLAMLRSSEEVGFYGVAYRLPELVMTAPGFLLVSVLPVLSRCRADQARFIELLRGFLRPLWLAALPISVGGALTAPDIVRLLAGPGFDQAELPARLLMCAMLPYFLSTMLGGALLAMGRDKQVARVAGLILALNVLINLAVIPSAGATGAAAVLCATEACLLATYAWSLATELGAPQARWIWGPVGATAGMAAAVLGVHAVTQDAGSLVRLGVSVLVGVLVYCVELVALELVPRSPT